MVFVLLASSTYLGLVIFALIRQDRAHEVALSLRAWIEGHLQQALAYGSLLVGLFLWDFFAEGTKTGLASLHAKAFLFQKVRVPLWVLVITSVAVQRDVGPLHGTMVNLVLRGLDDEETRHFLAGTAPDRARAVSRVFPWTRTLPIALIAWGVSPIWPITGIPARPMFRMIVFRPAICSTLRGPSSRTSDQW